MRWRRCLTLYSVIVCGLTACEQRFEGTSSGGPSNALPRAFAPAMTTNTNTLIYSDQALPRLPTVKLWLGQQEIAAEIASNPREMATGMMHRKEMGENEGMLFILPVPQQASFYMRNTHVPLSAAYIDTEGTILEIHDLQPLNEQPVYSKSDKIQFVLEVKQGWFKRNQIDVGTVIRTEFGTLRETFTRRRR